MTSEIQYNIYYWWETFKLILCLSFNIILPECHLTWGIFSSQVGRWSCESMLYKQDYEILASNQNKQTKMILTELGRGLNVICETVAVHLRAHFAHPRACTMFIPRDFTRLYHSGGYLALHMLACAFSMLYNMLLWFHYIILQQTFTKTNIASFIFKVAFLISITLK